MKVFSPFIILCLSVGFADGTDVLWNAPVIWESTDLYVASEVNTVYMDIELKSPCMILDVDGFDHEMMAAAKRVCADSYERTIDKLDSLINSPMVESPSNKWYTERGMATSAHSIQKRSLILLGVGAIVGFVATNTIFTYRNSVKVSKHDLEIGEMKHKMKVLKSHVGAMQGEFKIMAERYDKDMRRIFAIFNQTAMLNHLTTQSEIAMQRMVDAVVHSREKWRASKNSEFFFEVFQVNTTKLGQHLTSGKHMGIAFDKLSRTIHMSFTIPKTYDDLFIQKAIPIRLMSQENGNTCGYRYTGAPYALINANKTCVAPIDHLNMYGDKVVLFPILSCMTHANVTTNLHHYKKDVCHPSTPKDSDTFFFQYVIYDSLVLYCPKQKIEIAGSNRDCPLGSPFEMPAAQNFKIGKFVHTYNARNYTVSQQYDLERTVAINHAYQPLAKDLHLAPLPLSLFDDVSEMVETNWEMILLIIGSLLLLRMLVQVCSFVYKKVKGRMQKKQNFDIIEIGHI